MNRRRLTVLSALGAGAIVVSSAAAASAVSSWHAGGTGAGYAKAASVGAGNAPSASASGTSVTLVWNASSLSTGTEITSYTIKRYASGAATGTTATCAVSAGVTTGTYTCTESSVAEGSWQYTVRPKKGNWVGTESSKSSVVVVDTTAPTAPTITQPSANTNYYTTASVHPAQTAWPGSFAGAPGTDSGSGVARVDIQLSYQSGTGINKVTNYWNGTAWTTTASWVSAGSVWSYSWAASSFPATTTDYTVSARTVDNAGNVSTGNPSVTFTFKS